MEMLSAGDATSCSERKHAQPRDESSHDIAFGGNRSTVANPSDMKRNNNTTNIVADDLKGDQIFPRGLNHLRILWVCNIISATSCSPPLNYTRS